jgi:putative protease
MEEEIGRIIHYFSKINVAVLEMVEGKLKTGNTIHIKGHTTELYQKVGSMQVDYKPVDVAEKGMQVGLKVESHVRPNDRVYKISDDI